MESKHPKDMNEAEYREHFFKSKNWLGRSKSYHIAKFLYIFQFKFIKEPLGWRVKRRFNPYNPLSYIIILLTMLWAIVYVVLEALEEIFFELGKVFKYK